MIFGGSRKAETMKNKSLSIALLLILLPLLLPPFALSAQMIIESENQFEFAVQTMKRGEYLRAVGEFERFIHFFPEDEKVPQARYLMGVCYLEARDYDAARRVLDEVYRDYHARPIGGKALLLFGETYYRQGMFKQANHYFKKVTEAYPEHELKNAATYRMAWSRMKEDKWQEASETFMKVEESSPLFPSAQDLSQKSLLGEELPHKAPTTAGVMAGILPGLGHAYTHRYKDGLVAFLLNGVTILAAIEAFDEDLEVLGVILLFVELGWYTGNIYSAVNSAHKYNKKVRNDFRRSLPDKLKLGFFANRDGRLGLALRIDF
jgi:outer membrane protein assembly factor BamD (BamD/ComL family)